MTEHDCGIVRERLPDFAAGRSSAEECHVVEAHLPGCSECQAELELVQMLLAAPPAVPPALADRVGRAVRASRRPAHRPWWGISAAAIAALALGIGVSTERPEMIDGPVLEFVSETEAGDIWLSDDGLVAGAPTVDDLSDEALMELLEELAGEGAA